MNVRVVSVVTVAFLSLWVPASVSQAEDVVSLEAKGYVSGYAASGNRKLHDNRDIIGSNAGVQTRIRMSDELSLFVDARYFGSTREPENNVREAYLTWTTGDLSLRAGKQIIVWGRADRFNPTDLITPRNYQILAFDDDDQRFGVVGAEAKYRIADAYTVSALALPAFHTSFIPAGLLPAGIARSTEHERYSGENFQWGAKLDHNSGLLDWSVSYFNGFSALPEIMLRNSTELVLENRAIRMFGADFAASPGSWGIRGEAAYVELEREQGISALLPRSYFYSVLGVERTVAETMTLNIQWLYREIRDFIDPRTIPGPFGQIAMGNALIRNQFDRVQNGVSVSVRDRWLHDTLQAELSGVYFFTHHDYLVKPQIQYALNDHWSILLFADIYHGPDDSFLGGLKKNTLTYAELRYQFGPFGK